MSEYKIPCELIQDLMPLYVDGLTSDSTNEHIQEHLQTCDSCRQKYDRLNTSMACAEEEKKVEEQKEINYLKKVNKSNRKKLCIGFCSAVVIILLAVFVKVYVIGYAADNYTITDISIDIQHRPAAVIKGTFAGTKNVYCKYKISVQDDGTQKIIVYGCRPSPLHKETDFDIGIPLKSIDKKAEISGATIDKHGFIISALANELAGAWNPYIGDMPANEEIAQILGIRSALGDYENELQTEKAPYSWTFKFKGEISNPKAFDNKMKAYACLLMASIGNLDRVNWSYTENVSGNQGQHTASLTRRQGSELVKQEIFTDTHSPVVIQTFVNYLNTLIDITEN